MTQTAVDTVYEQSPRPETGLNRRPVRRGRTYMSLSRKNMLGTNAARPTEFDAAGERGRGVGSRTRGRRRLHTVVAGFRAEERAADGPEPPTRSPAPRVGAVPASLSVAQSADERYRRGIRPPDTQPMTHTRRRRFDRPSSVSRPNRTLMATDTPAKTSERIVPDSDSAPTTGGSAG